MLFEIFKWIVIILMVLAGTFSIYGIAYYDHPKRNIKYTYTAFGLFVAALIVSFCAMAIK